jgi:uncharacterized protein (DUF433 family)
VSDSITKLAEVLREAGARPYFDRGNNATNPCTFCGTRPPPDTAHKMVCIGTFGNGDPIRRPVCDQCMPVAEAKAKVAAATPVSVPEGTCPDCGWVSWAWELTVEFDEAQHCLMRHLESRAKGMAWRHRLACRDRTIARLRTQAGRSKRLCRHVLQMLDDGVALIDAGEPTGLREYDLPATTRARIEMQDAENQQLKLRLAESGKATESEASVMLVVVRPGRCGGQPTIGHTRLPLAAPLGRLRGGDSIAELARDWPDVPPESWAVLKALHEELQAEVEEENADVY